VRLVKNLASKAGIYGEEFPVCKRYEPPDFDEGYF